MSGIETVPESIGVAGLTTSPSPGGGWALARQWRGTWHTGANLRGKGREGRKHGEEGIEIEELGLLIEEW